MKASELMIGDMIRQSNSGLLLQVSCIQPPYITAVGEEGQFHEDTIEPIPLTFEILEKNGFDCGSKKWVLPRYPTDKYFGLVMDESGAYYFEAFHKIQFVHELQNVMRLCGIEKEFKL